MCIQCCKCKKVNVDGQWKTPNFDLPEIVSHTYCPKCLNDSLLALRV